MVDLLIKLLEVKAKEATEAMSSSAIGEVKEEGQGVETELVN